VAWLSSFTVPGRQVTGAGTRKTIKSQVRPAKLKRDSAKRAIVV
jgi:hypothetical protein